MAAHASERVEELIASFMRLVTVAIYHELERS